MFLCLLELSVALHTNQRVDALVPNQRAILSESQYGPGDFKRKDERLVPFIDDFEEELTEELDL